MARSKAPHKGHNYGTLLAGIETRRPAGILDERSSKSLAAWLAARPGAELTCRDWAGIYADGGARSAPDAMQAADRWHLWHNLGEAVERAAARHPQHMQAALNPSRMSLRCPRIAAVRWQEIRDCCCNGSCRHVRDHVARFRGNAAVTAPPSW